MKIKTDMIIEYKGEWKLEVNYGVPAQVETNFSSLKNAKKWQGSNFLVSLSPPFNYRGWKSNLIVERMNLTTQGVTPFSLNDSRYAFSVTYTL
jgi:hypothetical protein